MQVSRWYFLKLKPSIVRWYTQNRDDDLRTASEQATNTKQWEKCPVLSMASRLQSTTITKNPKLSPLRKLTEKVHKKPSRSGKYKSRYRNSSTNSDHRNEEKVIFQTKSTEHNSYCYQSISLSNYSRTISRSLLLGIKTSQPKPKQLKGFPSSQLRETAAE